jgi:cell division septum initiation protein DivIVA
MDSGVVTVLIIGAISLIFGLIIYLIVMMRRMNASFAKLGYLIREDAKKYFDEAADKIVDTNQQFQTTYTNIVHKGTQSALQDVSSVMKDAVVSAQQDAGSIIIEARKQAQDILIAAQGEAKEYKQRALEQSAQTLEWVIGQYVGKTYTDEQHIELIRSLLQEYISENRTSQ